MEDNGGDMQDGGSVVAKIFNFRAKRVTFARSAKVDRASGRDTSERKATRERKRARKLPRGETGQYFCDIFLCMCMMKMDFFLL